MVDALAGLLYNAALYLYKRAQNACSSPQQRENPLAREDSPKPEQADA